MARHDPTFSDRQQQPHAPEREPARARQELVEAQSGAEALSEQVAALEEALDAEKKRTWRWLGQRLTGEVPRRWLAATAGGHARGGEGGAGIGQKWVVISRQQPGSRRADDHSARLAEACRRLYPKTRTWRTDTRGIPGGFGGAATRGAGGVVCALWNTRGNDLRGNH